MNERSTISPFKKSLIVLSMLTVLCVGGMSQASAQYINDSAGNIITQYGTDESPNQPGQYGFDESGNPIAPYGFDGSGNPIVLNGYDANGNPIAQNYYDALGAPIPQTLPKSNPFVIFALFAFIAIIIYAVLHYKK